MNTPTTSAPTDRELRLQVERLRADNAELVEGLKWAHPLATTALEEARLLRVKCGHTDIIGTYSSGRKYVGIYQEEVDAIERSRALIAKHGS